MLPLREWIRQNCPEGNEGFVAEDIDLIIRWYGNQLDSDGRFRLCEHKYNDATIDYAQMKTFGLIDSILKLSPRYDGFYLIQTNLDITEIKVNGTTLTQPEFRTWLTTPDSTIPPYIFNEHRDRQNIEGHTYKILHEPGFGPWGDLHWTGICTTCDILSMFHTEHEARTASIKHHNTYHRPDTLPKR